MKIEELKAHCYFMPTEIVFGEGRLRGIGDRCRSLGRKPLIVTGKRSARANGSLDRILAESPDAVVFDQVEENPGTTTCDRAAARCRESGCDVVIGLGGGSPMDVAKAVAGLARNPGGCAGYFGRETFTEGALPVVAVPTTAGTGSEVTPYAVIVNEDTLPDARMKRTIAGKNLFPALALLDPELSLTVPAPVTVSTGLDALSQAMEGMVSKQCTPLGDILALEVCRIVKRWLPAAVQDGQNLNARSQMLYAAMLSGCVIAQSGTTLVHGMGYYLTLFCGIPHGLANALLLPPVFQFNAGHLPEKVAAIAQALGHPCKAEPAEARAAIGAALHDLLGACQVSPAGRRVGIVRERLPGFAKDIAADASRFRNQVGKITEREVLRFYEEAYGGEA